MLFGDTSTTVLFPKKFRTEIKFMFACMGNLHKTCTWWKAYAPQVIQLVGIPSHILYPDNHLMHLRLNPKCLGIYKKTNVQIRTPDQVSFKRAIRYCLYSSPNGSWSKIVNLAIVYLIYRGWLLNTSSEISVRPCRNATLFQYKICLKGIR